MVTCDADTPEATLQAIAESVPTDGWRLLAIALLEHATVLHSEPILEILASVKGPAYTEVRARAQMALDALMAGADPPVWAGDRVCSVYS